MWQIVIVELGMFVLRRNQILIGHGLRLGVTSRVARMWQGVKLRSVSRVRRPRELRLIMEHGAGNINPQRPVETWKCLGVIIGHELLKQEGNIHVNIRVNVARRTTASLTSDKYFNLTESTLNTNLNMMKLLARCHSQHDDFLGWLWRCIQPEITKDIFSRNESRIELCEQAAGLLGTTPNRYIMISDIRFPIIRI